MDTDTRLAILANAILDGTPVDWREIGSTADAGEGALVEQLQCGWEWETRGCMRTSSTC